MIKRCSFTLIGIAVLIGVISLSPVSAQTPPAYTIDFEGISRGSIVSSLSCGSGISCPGLPNVTVRVDGRNVIFPDSNTAMIFDAECRPRGGPQDCSGGDDDLFFPGHGNILINSEDLDGDDPDDQDRNPSFLEFDFFDLTGTVTINSIDVADVEEDESRDAFINFHEGRCNELSDVENIFDILPTGDNVIRTVQIGASAGISDAQCVQVRLNGSGAIDNIRFTVGPTPAPGIDIEKLTSGPGQNPQDADNANGNDVPQIVAGQTVTWTYVVTNTGNVTLTNVSVTDDRVGAISCPQTTLGVSQSMTCTATGTAETLTTGQGTVPGCGTPPRPTYENMGKVTGNPPTGPQVEDEDPSHYCNPPGEPGIHIEKFTNGVDADNPDDAPQIPINGVITWTYVVTNTTTDVPLANVIVVDDHGCPANNCQDFGEFQPTFTGGDTNGNGLLDFLPNGTSETWTYTAALDLAIDLSNAPNGVTIVNGCGTTPPRPTYQNRGVVTAQDAAGTPVEDADLSHYCNPPEPGIDIEKFTNGVDADDPNDAPQIPINGVVTWTYVVTNTTDVPLQNVDVVDDHGCPANNCQDFGEFRPIFTGGDTNGNGLLDFLPNGTSETWTYQADQDLAIDLSNAPNGVTIVNGCGTTPPRPTYQNRGVVTARDAAGTNVEDADLSHYCNPVVDDPAIHLEKYTKIVAGPTGGDLCETLGKPKMFTWRYTGDNEIKHSQKQGSVKGKGELNGETPVLIESGDFEETVEIGTDFESDDGKIKIKDPSDPKGKKVIKEIEIHTSCSQPLVLGDKYGGVQLVGFTSKDGKSATFNPNANTNTNTNDRGEDADDPRGPEGQQGDTVVWTYEVTNPGDVALSNVVVTDDHQGVTPTSVLGDTNHNIGDTNRNGLLDFLPNGTSETWIYRAEGTVGSGQYNNGQYKNVGEACGHGAGQNVCDDDPSHHFFEAPPVDICPAKGKPQQLIMQYTSGISSSHSQKEDKVNIEGVDPGNRSSVFIISSDEEDGDGKIFIAEEVNLNQQFILNGAEGFKSQTFVFIYDQEGGNLLQTIEFHTSCSQPLLPNDQFGAIKLIGG